MVTDGKTPTVTPSALVTVRATVNLSGLRAGNTVLVDPSQPYIADCLKANYLVALPEGEQQDAFGE